jgi:CRP-like cAMP-binding protein
MRLAALVDRVQTLSLVSASARFAHWLLQAPTGGAADSYVELPMSKRELAAHLAMAPETLSRLLRRWKEEGYISAEGRRIRVLDGARLIELADGSNPGSEESGDVASRESG